MAKLSHRIKIFVYNSLKISDNNINEEGTKGTEIIILF